MSSKTPPVAAGDSAKATPTPAAAAAASRPLRTAQIRSLRARSHGLKPVVTIGERGITQALVDELDAALEHHELLKVRLPAVNKAERVALGDLLSARSGAQVINRVGRIVALYRKRKEQPAPPALKPHSAAPSRRRREGR